MVGQSGQAWYTPALQPALQIIREANGVRINWPASATGYGLQTSAQAGNGWTTAPGPVTDEGGEKVYRTTTGAAVAFYRLLKP
jgi:hypothetical protein